MPSKPIELAAATLLTMLAPLSPNEIALHENLHKFVDEVERQLPQSIISLELRQPTLCQAEYDAATQFRSFFELLKLEKGGSKRESENGSSKPPGRKREREGEDAPVLSYSRDCMIAKYFQVFFTRLGCVSHFDELECEN
jgi:Tfp pilus assembly protein PilP